MTKECIGCGKVMNISPQQQSKLYCNRCSRELSILRNKQAKAKGDRKEEIQKEIDILIGTKK